MRKKSSKKTDFTDSFTKLKEEKLGKSVFFIRSSSGSFIRYKEAGEGGEHRFSANVFIPKSVRKKIEI